MRSRFAYYLPLLGEVCRAVFCRVYNISTPTLTVYRNRVAEVNLNPMRHSLAKNTNAATVNVQWVVQWFESLAAMHAEIVPLRLRRVVKENGEVVRRVSKIDHQLLPSHYT